MSSVAHQPSIPSPSMAETTIGTIPKLEENCKIQKSESRAERYKIWLN